MSGQGAPTLPEICQVLRVEPGQTLIVRISPDRRLDRQQADELQGRIADLIPGVRVVLVFADELAVAPAAAVAEPMLSAAA